LKLLYQKKEETKKEDDGYEDKPVIDIVIQKEEPKKDDDGYEDKPVTETVIPKKVLPKKSIIKPKTTTITPKVEEKSNTNNTSKEDDGYE